jgi:hypothetical protein
VAVPAAGVAARPARFTGKPRSIRQARRAARVDPLTAFRTE